MGRRGRRGERGGGGEGGRSTGGEERRDLVHIQIHVHAHINTHYVLYNSCVYSRNN